MSTKGAGIVVRDGGARLWCGRGVRPIVVATAVALASLVFAVDARATGWAPQNSGTTNNLRGASFVSASQGWIVGDNGTIVTTTNGGATWTAQTSNTTVVLTAVSFVDANDGWAVGDSGTILVTSNGGATWTPQTSGVPNQLLLSVKFVNLNDGWVVGSSGTIQVTTNGGATWTPQTSGVTHDLTGVSALDANHAWAVGQHDFAINGPPVLATTNGGMNWNPQTTPAGTTDDLQAVQFVDANHGWAVGYHPGTPGNGLILVTTNGGGTWSPEPANAGDSIIYGIAAVDANHAWAVANTGLIIETTDGSTWAQQYSTQNQFSFVNVAFADVNHGWALGLGGHLLAYTASSTVTPPTISLTNPVNGAQYGRGSVVHASYSCTPAVATTITSCTGSVANGAAIDTSTTGSHTFTVHAIDADGGTATATAKYTVTTPAGGQGPPMGVVLSTSVWAAGATVPSLTGGLPGNPIRILPGNPTKILPGNPIKIVATVGTGAPARDARVHRHIGTKFTFKLSKQATVTVLLTQHATGRKQGKRCVRQTARNRHKPKCSGNVLVGGLRFGARAGSSVLHFAGRLSKKKSLKPGAYAAVVYATYANGTVSAPKVVRFKIVKH